MKTHNSMKILVLFGLVFSQLGFANKEKRPLPNGQFQSLFTNREDYPAVVQIYNKFGFGTAFFISPELVVTNFHVILLDFKDSIDNTFIETVNEKEIPIKSIVALDGINDLAILQVKDYQSEDYYELRFNNKPTSLNQKVHTMGFPGGEFRYGQGNIHKKTSNNIYANIQGMRPGFSGSPVFSNTGELVGVLSVSTGYSVGLVSFEKLKELLSKGSLNCDSSICISEEIGRIKDLAEQGDRKAQFMLARMYFEGLGVEQNYEEAFKWFEMAALHIEAQFNLAVMYLEGIGVKKNYEEAFKWFEMAALQGDRKAQFELGYMYFEGLGVEQNYEEAFKWFEMAALQGDRKAQFELGYMYFEGLGVEQNYEEAFKWFEMAALQGDMEAQSYLDKYFKR